MGQDFHNWVCWLFEILFSSVLGLPSISEARPLWGLLNWKDFWLFLGGLCERPCDPLKSGFALQFLPPAAIPTNCLETPFSAGCFLRPAGLVSFTPRQWWCLGMGNSVTWGGHSSMAETSLFLQTHMLVLVSTSHRALIPALGLPFLAWQPLGVGCGWLQYSYGRNIYMRKPRTLRIVRILWADMPGSSTPGWDWRGGECWSLGCHLLQVLPSPHAPWVSPTPSRQVLPRKQVREGSQPWPWSPIVSWLPLPVAFPLPFRALSFRFGVWIGGKASVSWVQGQLGRRTGVWSLDRPCTCLCSSLTACTHPSQPTGLGGEPALTEKQHVPGPRTCIFLV